MKSVANFIDKIANAIAPGVDWTAIKPTTWVRWILAAISTLNNVLLIFDINPIQVSENDLYFVVSLIFNILILIVNTYKDNPTSKEGIFTNELMKLLKSKSIDEDDLIYKIRDLIASETDKSEPKSDAYSPRSPTDSESSSNVDKYNDCDVLGDADIPAENEDEEDVDESSDDSTEK